MVDDFVNRKHGRAAVDYFHDDLENTLKSTYGVIVYQEQVMLISQIIGGYSLGGADLLRRAMGKKKPEEMAKHRELFEQGAKEKGHDPDLAVKLFDLMEKFAGYGFNKSHSAAYALISYQTAWLKAYHPTEFLAATMSSDMDDTDKVQIFCRDAQDNGGEVLPPDVNFSGYRFEPVADKHTEKGRPPRTMRYGLGAVKGTGQGAVEEILRARKEAGPFQNLFDFCRRVNKHAVNRRTIEALIKAGAFDTIEPNRAAMLASVPTAMEAAEQAARSANQASLFGDDSGDVVAGELAKVAPWDLHKKLTEEKSALGYYYSGHLFDAWRDEVRRIVPMQLVRVEPQRDLQWMCGVLASVRVMMTRRGKMVFAVLDDGTAQVEISVFNELYEKHRNRLREDQLVIVQGKVSNDDYSGGMRIVAEQLYDLQLAREARAKSLRVKLNGSADAARLRQMLNPFRAEPENGIPGVPVDIVYTKNNFLCTVRLGEEWRVRMADTLLANLNEWTKPDGVEVTY
jgi:DNA polymerase-3 subunit alpha